jgi:hypothetical protein
MSENPISEAADTTDNPMQEISPSTEPEQEGSDQIKDAMLFTRKRSLRRCGFALMLLYLLVLISPVITYFVITPEMIRSLFEGPNPKLAITFEDGFTVQTLNSILLTIGLMTVFVNTLMVIGAYKMWSLKESVLVRPTALYALLPVCTVPLWPLTLICGVIAMFLLSSSDGDALLE